jgi:hypothetical protein
LQQLLSKHAESLIRQCKPHHPLLLSAEGGTTAGASSSGAACQPAAVGALHMQQRMQAFQEVVVVAAHKLSLNIGGRAAACRLLEQLPRHLAGLVRTCKKLAEVCLCCVSRVRCTQSVVTF